MKFRKEIQIPKNDIQINLGENILTLGSCFAVNISDFLKRYLFNTLSNPFGTLYNPASILNSLELINAKTFDESQLVYNQDEWHSFYHNSFFSHYDKEKCIKNINDSIDRARNFLPKADWVILTLGSSYIYRYLETELIVSNCHKLPAELFAREFLTNSESKEYINLIIKFIRGFSPPAKFIITVSPIRHLKDGEVNNQRSKSALITAAHNAVSENENVFYFPAYEIMMDDLRDYRFYAEDLVHPNYTAVKYIWEKFKRSYFAENLDGYFKDVENLRKGLEHRPRIQDSPVSEKFKNSLSEIIKKLKKNYPNAKFEDLNL